MSSERSHAPGCMRGINLHIVRNGLAQDSRVLRTTKTLLECGLFSAVHVAAFEQPGLPEKENLEGRQVWRVSLRSRRLPKDLLSQSFKYAEWRHRIIAAHRMLPLAVIHCHDLEPLPLAVRLKRLTGARLVYDAHELETERAHLGRLRKWLLCAIEERCVRQVDALITVSPSIQGWYREKFPWLPVGLVRNVPEVHRDPLEPVDLRARLHVAEHALLFIFQGSISSGRSVDLILDAFADRAVVHHVVFLGEGALADKVRGAARSCDRIHWLPPVRPESVLTTTAGADVGLSLIEDVSLSYRYCLPNKLFEYWAAGIPVLASALPDQASLVNQYRAGWVVPVERAHLIATLCGLRRSDVEGVRAGVGNAVRELNWSNEASRLLSIYQQALATQGKR